MVQMNCHTGCVEWWPLAFLWQSVQSFFCPVINCFVELVLATPNPLANILTIFFCCILLLLVGFIFHICSIEYLFPTPNSNEINRYRSQNWFDCFI